jgi:hypothetical protein
VSTPAHLVPPSAAEHAEYASRMSFAFGRRFFLLLLIGLVWLGPAWSNPRYLYAMAIWDVGVFVLWAWDLAQLPKPNQLECRRTWIAPLQLSVEAIVTIEIRNAGDASILAQVIDDAPPLSQEIFLNSISPLPPVEQDRRLTLSGPASAATCTLVPLSFAIRARGASPNAGQKWLWVKHFGSTRTWRNQNGTRST